MKTPAYAFLTLLLLLLFTGFNKLAAQAARVVEWVEDDETACIMADRGVDYLQGHCFGMAELSSPWDSQSPTQTQTGRTGENEIHLAS